MQNNKEIKVLLFKGRGIFSRLIRWKTNSRFSHAAILLPDGETIIEAWQGAGVRKKKVKDWEDIEIFNISLDDNDTKLVINYLEDQIGRKYDWLGALGIALNKNIHDNEKFFCFKLVYAALAIVGYNLLERTAPHEVTGNLIYRSPLLWEDEVPF